MTTETNPRMSGQKPDSLPELIKALRDETTVLLRQEVALAKQELSEKTSEIARNAGYLIAGGLIAYAGAVIIILGIAVVAYVLLIGAGLSSLFAGWLAPLLVGAIVAGIGYALVTKALTTLRVATLVPERTVETLQNNKEWIKEKVTK